MNVASFRDVEKPSATILMLSATKLMLTITILMLNATNLMSFALFILLALSKEEPYKGNLNNVKCHLFNVNCH